MISILVNVIQTAFYSFVCAIVFLIFAGPAISLFVFIGSFLVLILFSIMETWTELRRRKSTNPRLLDNKEDPRRADIVSVLVAIFTRRLVKSFN